MALFDSAIFDSAIFDTGEDAAPEGWQIIPQPTGTWQIVLNSDGTWTIQ